MSQEKRQSSRSDVFLIADYRPLNKSVEYSTGITDNFSSEGLSFETQDVHLKTGDILELRLKSPQNGLMVSAVGEIAWRQEGWYKCTLGVRFKEIDQEDRKKIFAFITDEKSEQDSSLVKEEPSPPLTEKEEDAAAEERSPKETTEDVVLESIAAGHEDKLQEDSLHDEAGEKPVAGAVAQEVSEGGDEEHTAPVSDSKDEERLTEKKEENNDRLYREGRLEYAYSPRRRKRQARKSRRSLHIAAAVLALGITVPIGIYILDIQTDTFVPAIIEEITGESERIEQPAPVPEASETQSLPVPELSSSISPSPTLPEAIVPDSIDIVPVQKNIPYTQETVSEEPAAKETVSTLSPGPNLIREETQEAEKPVSAVKEPEKGYAAEDEKKIAIEHIIKRKSTRLQTVTTEVETPVPLQKIAVPQKELPEQKVVPGIEEKNVSPAAIRVEPAETVTDKTARIKKLAMDKQVQHTEQPGKSLLSSEKNLIADPVQTGEMDMLSSAPEEKQTVIFQDEVSPFDKPIMEVEEIESGPADLKIQEIIESIPVTDQTDIETADQPVVKIDPPVAAEPALKIQRVSEPQPVRKKSIPSIGLSIRSKKK